jgi:hypothetical protein
MLHDKKKERSNPNTSAKIKDYHKDESQLSQIQIKSEYKTILSSGGVGGARLPRSHAPRRRRTASSA